jgi:hypothetical protein
MLASVPKTEFRYHSDKAIRLSELERTGTIYTKPVQIFACADGMQRGDNYKHSKTPSPPSKR